MTTKNREKSKIFQISPYTVRTQLKINLNLEEKNFFFTFTIKLLATVEHLVCVCVCVCVCVDVLASNCQPVYPHSPLCPTSRFF